MSVRQALVLVERRGALVCSPGALGGRGKGLPATQVDGRKLQSWGTAQPKSTGSGCGKETRAETGGTRPQLMFCKTWHVDPLSQSPQILGPPRGFTEAACL